MSFRTRYHSLKLRLGAENLRGVGLSDKTIECNKWLKYKLKHQVYMIYMTLEIIFEKQFDIAYSGIGTITSLPI
jgi:hypothetical protein